MYGDDSPAPPPDYTMQRQAEASAESERRRAQARDYNAQVESFNNNARNFGNEVFNFGKGYSTLGIQDLNNKQEYKQLDDLSARLASLRFDNEKPNWSPTITSYGQSVSVDTPSLKNIDQNYLSNMERQLGQYRSTLDNLYNQRKIEEDRVGAYTNAFTSDINRALNGLDNLNIGDMSGLQSARNAQLDLESRFKNFRTPLANYNLNDWQDELTTLNTRLNDLFSQRSAEQNRIDNYRKSLTSDIDNYNRQLRGLGIADLDKINALNDLIDNRIADVNRFESPLTYDFGRFTNELSAADRGIENLLAKRADELERVRTYQDRALANAEDYLASANNMDVYSRSALDDLNRRLTLGEREIQGFSSPLSFDFSGSQSAIDAAQARIAELLAQREANLANIRQTGGALDDDIANIPLYDETTYNNRLSQLRDQLDALGQYSGAGVSPINSELGQVRTALENRLRELSAYRGTIESDAQKYINDLKAQGLYNIDEVQGLMGDGGRLGQLRQQIDQYKASQAEDEYRTLQTYLDTELARLQAEARQRDALAARERAALLDNGGQTFMVNGVPLTEAEYLALIKKKEEVDYATPINAFTAGLAG